MARKSKGKSTRTASDPDRLRRVRRTTFHAVLLIVLLSGGIVGYFHLSRWVRTQVSVPDQAPTLVLKNKPAWMSEARAAEILAPAVQVVPTSALDHQVLVNITEILRHSTWVRNVNQVRRAYSRSPGDTIEIDCEFRTPVALVPMEGRYHLVDAEGVRLPESYSAPYLPKVLYTPAGQTNLRIIEGVDSSRKWPGKDLLAGLDLARYLQGYTFTNDLIRINVANFEGRRNAHEAQLTIFTKDNHEVRWGRPVRSKDGFVFDEVNPGRKLEYLRDLYNQYKRVDAGHPWIDLRLDRIRYPEEARSAQASIRP
jgi:hypothetical protein